MTLPMGHVHQRYHFSPTNQAEVQTVDMFDGDPHTHWLHPEKPQVFTVRLQRSSSGTLGLQLRGLDVVTWHVTTFDGGKPWGGESDLQAS